MILINVQVSLILGVRGGFRDDTINLDKRADAGVTKSDIRIDDANPNSTDAQTNVTVDIATDAQIVGVPIDKIFIYACGEKD